MSSGYEVDEVAEILSFSPRWVRALIKRYNEGGAEALGDQRIHNGTRPTILTPEALAALKERIKTPPDDGGLWTGPKIAPLFAKFHGLQSVHDQRGSDALIAIGYSIQQPRPRHPDAATKEDRAALKPAHSPELQPAQHLWAFVDEPLANCCFATIESLDEPVSDRCVVLVQQPNTIRDNTLFHWWPCQRAKK